MPTPKKLLLVDANIISHALTPNQTLPYVTLFQKLEVGYRFVVTGFTKYEVMCSSDKSHKAKIDEFLEQNMAYVSLSKPLMDFASRVFYLYTTHPSTKGQKITMGDIVNAAFSIAKPCDVLTIDNNDYPRPFFEDVSRERVSYLSKQKNTVTDTVHLLRPDTENLKECFKNHKV